MRQDLTRTVGSGKGIKRESVGFGLSDEFEDN